MLKDVVEEYYYHCLSKGFTDKTMINKRQELNALIKFLSEKRGISELENVTAFDLRALVRSKQIKGLQAQSIESTFKIIKAFFNWCVKEEYINGNIAAKVDTPKVPKKVLNGFTLNEVRKMIDSFNAKSYLEIRNKAIVAMLADCGMRAMELRGLKTAGVKESTIFFKGKGNKERIVYISPALKRILIKYERIKKQYFSGKDTTDHYFLTYLGSGLTHVSLDNIVKEAGKRAGIEGKRVSPHTFRHFYAVQCLAEGNIDVYSLSRLLGHSDISITQRYLHSLNDEQLSSKALASSPLMSKNK